jgi:hypothetical protein
LLRPKPGVELRRHAVDAVQQGTAIERRRPGQRSRFRCQTLEQDGVDLDTVQVETDRLALGGDGIENGLAERLPNGGEGLAQGIARLGLAPVTPEQPGQPITRQRPAGIQGEISQQEAILPGR